MRPTSITFVTAAFVAYGGCALAQDAGSAPPMSTLVVEAAHGSVRINGKPGATEIVWTTRPHAHSGESHAATEIYTGHDVTRIVLASPADITLTVPQSLAHTRVYTGEGDVAVTRVDGDALLQSEGGSIAIDQLKGRAQLDTGGGEVSIRHNASPVTAHTGGGNITVDAGGADVEAATDGGNITVTAVRGSAHLRTDGGNINVHQAAGGVLLVTAEGNVDAGDIGGEVRIKTGGGTVRVASAGGSLWAQSSDGAIECHGLHAAAIAHTDSGNITADFAKGAHPSTPSQFVTGSGDVFVTMPRDLAVSVHVAAANAIGHTIQSALSGIRVAAASIGGWLHADGSLNGGGPAMTVETGNGSVRFMSEK